MDDYETRNAREWNEGPAVVPIVGIGRSQLSKTEHRLPLHLRPARPVERILIKPASQRSLGDHQAVINGIKSNRRARTAGNAPNGRSRVPLKNVPVDEDNEAKAAWRMNRPPTGKRSITLPCSYQELDNGSFSRAQGNARYSLLEELGVKTGTYIRPPTTYSDRVLRIWGKVGQVETAKSEITRWIRSRKSVAAQGDRPHEFAKIYSLSDRQKASLDKQIKDDTKRQSYRQTPANTNDFQNVGYFLWPSAEIPPDACLGKGFEVLDPIRLAYACHIVYVPDRWVFKVMSNKVGAVEEALVRLRGAVCDVVCRNRDPVRLFLVAPPNCLAIRKQVDLIKTDNQTVIPTLAGARLTQEELSSWEISRTRHVLMNEQRMKFAIIRCLTDMLFYRGHVRMRVYFGTLVLSAYKKPEGDKHGLEEFLEMMNSSQTRGDLVHDLEQSKVEGSLISRCCRRGDLLEPVDALTSKLEDVKPNYSARLYFDLPSDDTGPQMLEVRFSRAPQGDNFEVSERSWYRGSPEAPLDINVFNLERQSGWQLQISAGNSMNDSKVDEELRGFVDHLILEPPAKGTGLLIRIPLRFPRSGPRPRKWVLKTAFQYQLQHSAYRFELAMHQTWQLGPDTSSAEREANAAPAVRWGASLYSKGWDEILSQQPCLGVGQRGMWSARLNTFFPNERGSTDSVVDVGFRDFISKVETVSKLVKGDKQGQISEFPDLGGLVD